MIVRWNDWPVGGIYRGKEEKNLGGNCPYTIWQDVDGILKGVKLFKGFLNNFFDNY